MTKCFNPDIEKALKAFDEELHDRMEELLDMALKSKTKFTSIEF